MALTIRLVPGTPVYGLWCPACLLPSGIEVTLYTLHLDGVRRAAVLRKCRDCGRKLDG